MCKFCEAINAKQIFTEQQIERILLEIYVGNISIERLDVETYLAIADYLLLGVDNGFGKTIQAVEFGTPDYEMLSSLRENVYHFSAAKTYQQTKAMSAEIYQGERVVPFYEFKKKALEIFEDYNVHYLSAEYNLAINSSRSAALWQDITRDADILPMLQYKTAGDSRVRPTHMALDNIIRPVTDRFWDRYMPPNGWNCRCTVLQLDDSYKKTPLSDFKKPDDVPELFLFNPGKEKIVYPKGHPYFDVPVKDRGLAQRNFNLPING